MTQLQTQKQDTRSRLLSRVVPASALALFVCAAGAQNVVNLDGVVSAPTILIDGGRYNSCGMRFVGSDMQPQKIFPVYALDFNLALMRGAGDQQLYVLLKTEFTRYDTAADVTAVGGKKLKVTDTWIQREGVAAIAPMAKGVPGQNKLSWLVPYPIEGTLDTLVTAVGGGATLLVGLQVAGDASHRIFRFTPVVKKDDGEAFFACSKALLDQALPVEKK